MWYIFSLLTVALGLEYLVMIAWFWRVYRQIDLYLGERGYKGELRRSIRSVMFHHQLNQDAVTLWLVIISTTTVVLWAVTGMFWLAFVVINKI